MPTEFLMPPGRQLRKQRILSLSLSLSLSLAFFLCLCVCVRSNANKYAKSHRRRFMADCYGPHFTTSTCCRLVGQQVVIQQTVQHLDTSERCERVAGHA